MYHLIIELEFLIKENINSYVVYKTTTRFDAKSQKR